MRLKGTSKLNGIENVKIEQVKKAGRKRKAEIERQRGGLRNGSENKKKWIRRR